MKHEIADALKAEMPDVPVYAAIPVTIEEAYRAGWWKLYNQAINNHEGAHLSGLRAVWNAALDASIDATRNVPDSIPTISGVNTRIAIANLMVDGD
jgi:hypothetical protein